MRRNLSLFTLALFILAALPLGVALPAAAGDSFRRIPVTQLTLTEGQWPQDPDAWARLFPWRPGGEMLQPTATLDGPGEIYLERRNSSSPQDYQRYFAPEAYVANIRIPAGGASAGRLTWPAPQPAPQAKGTGPAKMIQLRFTAPESPSTSETRRAFFTAKADYYANLARQGIAGAAWFRHQAQTSRAAAGQTTSTRDRFARNTRPFIPGQFGDPDREDWQLAETYSLFGGGRALSENLQLNRTLNVAESSSETVAINSLSGISTREMDWSKLTAGLKPAADALAKAIPYDQHAIFFPSFQAMVDVMDEAREEGTPVLRLVESRSEDARTRERYERQLCLAADALGRLIGPRIVASVAFTGSDPYLRAGSDVAVIFAAVDAKVLAPLIAARQELARQANPEAKPVNGEIAGVAWQGVRSPDRAVCSYMATVENTVVVANSLAQLGRIIETLQGKTKALSQTGEYIFFRDRYRLGAADETGLLILSDAAIRRWCGPRWRIGASRRLRAQAELAELQARHLDELAQGKTPAAEKVPGLGEVSWTSEGPSSSIYGSLAFMTPIAELPLERATSTEATAYNFFRDNYQNNWTRYFDPIALRLTAMPGRLATDLTVMPLILGSDYRHFTEVTGKAQIKPGAGDPHPEAWLHLLLAIDREADTIRQLGQMMTQMRGMARQGVPTPNPLGWLGPVLSVYADDDPFWTELQAAQDRGAFMDKNIGRLPLGINIEVADGLNLAVFLTTLRGLVEQSAPGLTTWSTETYKDHPYVKIAVARGGPAGEDPATSGSRQMAIYYASTPRALVVSPNEQLVRRAIDRLTSATQPGAAKTEWLGKQLAFSTRLAGLELFRGLAGESYQQAMQRRAWSNLPILNEWHRLYPNQSPADFHARFWQTRLTAPAGGEYVWNEKWQTMESTVYGHPGQPKPGPKMPELLSEAKGLSMGVTFENEGLRGRIALERGNGGK